MQVVQLMIVCTSVQRKSTLDRPKATQNEQPFAFLFSLMKKETKKSRLHKTRLKFGSMAENKQAPAFPLFHTLGGLTG